MRVLDTYTGQFVEIDPRDSKTKYAILSHTWDLKGEQTYQKLRAIQKRYAPSDDDDDDDTENSSVPVQVPLLDPTSGEPLSPIWGDPKLSPKIREACRVARENGYRYIWIDSCCIDKTSSSELSESINSMYQWYARADVCYAFLPDVPAEEDHRRKGSRFRRSRWFTRGWTLQELIAPVDVVFLSKDWTFIGSKDSLAHLVVEITNISYNALLHIEPLDDCSVAQRLSWASKRETTRVEDQAYSLLGIFDINMPTLYGEGERAFRRLQEEIMRRTPDQSLFAWMYLGLDASSQLHDPNTVHADKEKPQVTITTYEMQASLLAPSLDFFSKCAGIEALSHDEVVRGLQLYPDDLPATDYDFTPYGIRVQLPVISFSFSDYFLSGCVGEQMPFSRRFYLVILGCGHKDFPGHLLGRVCYIQSSGSIEFLHSGGVRHAVMTGRSESQDHRRPFDLLPLSPATITRLRHSSRSPISLKTLYIPQPKRDRGASDNVARRKPHQTIKLLLPEKTHDALSAQGYKATLVCGPDDVHPTTHSVTLSHDTHTITIDYQHTLGKDYWGGQQLTIAAHVKTSGPILQNSPGDLGVPQVDSHGTQVSWTDTVTPSWREELDFRNVELSTPGPTALTVWLGLSFATRNHYLLRIELTVILLPHSTPVTFIEHEPHGRITV